MIKATVYENHYVIPALRRHITNACRQQETYTKEEKRLREILQETNPKTFIGFSIHNRLSSGELGSFREMVKELNDQARVARKELIKAIGSEAVELIETISK